MIMISSGSEPPSPRKKTPVVVVSLESEPPSPRKKTPAVIVTSESEPGTLEKLKKKGYGDGRYLRR